MTTETKKVEALLKHIRNEFPNGCEDMDCKDCPLDGKIGSMENCMCRMLLDM